MHGKGRLAQITLTVPKSAAENFTDKESIYVKIFD